MRVVALDAPGAPSSDDWDRFVAASTDGTPFHRTAWREVVAEVFGHEPHYLAALSAGEIRGVLPLFDVRGLRSGRCLSSTPYAVYGGLCGPDPEAAAALLAAARGLGKRLHARHVELRQLHHPAPGLPTRRPFATFTRLLDPDPEAVFRGIPRKQRRMVRRALDEGFVPDRSWERLRAFYEVYAVDRRRLGAPPFPLRLFAAIRDRFGADAELLTLEREGRLAAGVLTFFHGERVLPYYGASLPAARRRGANDAMYWELMRASCLAGRRVFDFGQSHPGSGTWAFKSHWGFHSEPISHQYLLIGAGEAPSANPSSARGRLATGLWKRVPLPVTKWLGPALIRRLPLH